MLTGNASLHQTASYESCYNALSFVVTTFVLASNPQRTGNCCKLDVRWMRQQCVSTHEQIAIQSQLAALEKQIPGFEVKKKMLRETVCVRETYTPHLTNEGISC